MGSVREVLVNIKHSSKSLTYLWYIFRQPKFIVESNRIEKAAQNRKNGALDEQYIGMKRFQGIHNGQRCFIVATGPSLKISDLELLKNECTFGMNTICKLYDETDWRPTYYGIQDSNVYEKIEKDILKAYHGADNVFVSDTIGKRFGTPENFQLFPWNSVYHDNQLEIDEYFAKFSDDSYSIVYDGYSITYSLIQIAVYMGFKEIYLIGADCSYKKGQKNHIVESGFIDKNEEKCYDRLIVGYKMAKEYAENNGIKIINCTRGGMLEIFPRENLEDVLSK